MSLGSTMFAKVAVAAPDASQETTFDLSGMAEALYRMQFIPAAFAVVKKPSRNSKKPIGHKSRKHPLPDTARRAAVRPVQVTFTRVHDMRRHCLSAHAGVQYLGCSVCGKTFSRKDALLRHHQSCR
ncbi:hypothetical protein B0H11DRAFT_2038345 [Mycena galericulata]|nr:hypothetical protein B0H11DRAFT_2038345 [Mycena galericulata]